VNGLGYVYVSLFLCYNNIVKMEKLRQSVESYGIPDEVLKGIVSDGSKVDFHSSFEREEFGDTPRERNVHVFLRNTLDETGRVKSFTIEFKNQGRLVGVFAVAVGVDGGLNVVHRRVDPEYQGYGFGSAAFDIVEMISALSGRAVEVDITEPDVKTPDGGFAVSAVQLDTLAVLGKRGFLPADSTALGILQKIEAKEGFDFVHPSDSGPKAIPQSREPISVVMRGGVGGGVSG